LEGGEGVSDWDTLGSRQLSALDKLYHLIDRVDLQEMEEKRQISNLPPASPDVSSPRGGRQSPISMQGKKGEWMKIGSTKSSRFQVKKPDQQQQNKPPTFAPPTSGPIHS